MTAGWLSTLGQAGRAADVLVERPVDPGPNV
jgi:hypothetical protein